MWRSYYTESFQLISNLFISVDKPIFEDRLTLLRKSDQQKVHFIANYPFSWYEIRFHRA